jgi:hypothetical protein
MSKWFWKTSLQFACFYIFNIHNSWDLLSGTPIIIHQSLSRLSIQSSQESCGFLSVVPSCTSGDQYDKRHLKHKEEALHRVSNKINYIRTG